MSAALELKKRNFVQIIGCYPIRRKRIRRTAEPLTLVTLNYSRDAESLRIECYERWLPQAVLWLSDQLVAASLAGEASS